ncbi:MAG TPA: hypothetical protein VI756_02360, partial [Blastocatellia bacterium]
MRLTSRHALWTLPMVWIYLSVFAHAGQQAGQQTPSTQDQKDGVVRADKADKLDKQTDKQEATAPSDKQQQSQSQSQSPTKREDAPPLTESPQEPIRGPGSPGSDSTPDIDAEHQEKKGDI